MQNKATVIIPCFNVEAYIIDCLDSVELQGESVYPSFIAAATTLMMLRLAYLKQPDETEEE